MIDKIQQHKEAIQTAALGSAGAGGFFTGLLFNVADIAQAITMILGCLVMVMTFIMTWRKFRRDAKKK